MSGPPKGRPEDPDEGARWGRGWRLGPGARTIRSVPKVIKGGSERGPERASEVVDPGGSLKGSGAERLSARGSSAAHGSYGQSAPPAPSGPHQPHGPHGPNGPATGPAGRPRKRIIEREVVGATHEARRIVQEAEAEAQRILEEAREQAAETHQRGFEEGREAGLAEHTRQIAHALLRVRRIEEQLEAEYIGLLRECVEKIIGQELQQAPEAIVGVVRTALLDARQQREVIVRVNPDDAETLRRQQPRLLEVLARANTIDVRPDPGITRGGCVVATELGTIDATLERQLEALVAAVEAELGNGGGEAELFEDEEADAADR